MEAKQKWDKFAPVYEKFDPPLQTFYYTLLNMMAVEQATHILDVACGSCRLVPECLRRKPLECTYLATDNSANMLEYARINFAVYCEKMGIDQSFNEFTSRHHLQLLEHNAEEPLPQLPYQLDRIIINLMLMIAKDPVQVLKHLHHAAAPNCILGLTVWGSKADSSFLGLFGEARAHLELETSPQPSPFDFYDRIEEVGTQAGWQLVQKWDQVVAHNFTEYTQQIEDMIVMESRGDEKVAEWVRGKVKATFASKKPVVFSAQLAILRKK